MRGEDSSRRPSRDEAREVADRWHSDGTGAKESTLIVERTFYHQVHGAAYRNEDGSSRQEIIRRCGAGDEVFLVPEPDNAYDSDALKICTAGGEQIGYWAADGGWMANDIAAGREYRLSIHEIYPFDTDPDILGVQLRIEVLAPDVSQEGAAHHERVERGRMEDKSNRWLNVVVPFFAILLLGAIVVLASRSGAPTPTAAVSPTEAAPQPDGNATSWNVQTTAAIDGTSNVTAMLDDDSCVENVDCATLILRKKGRTLEAFVSTTAFIGTDEGGSDSDVSDKVRWRLNGGKLHTEHWTPAQSGDALFSPQASHFIAALGHAGTKATLQLEYKPYEKSRETVTFTLPPTIPSVFTERGSARIVPRHTQNKSARCAVEEPTFKGKSPHHRANREEHGIRQKQIPACGRQVSPPSPTKESGMGSG